MISTASLAAFANPTTEKEQKENLIQTEITVGTPVLYVRTTNAQGTSSSVSAYGYFLDAALCPLQTSCATLSTHSHLDIKSGRRVFEGSDVGVRWFLMGETDKKMRTSQIYLAEQLSQTRFFLGMSLAQRNFDFRTVVEEKVDVFVGSRPTLEGAFWAFSGSAGGDILIAKNYRIGLNISYAKSISSSVRNFILEQVLLDLRLLHLKF